VKSTNWNGNNEEAALSYCKYNNVQKKKPIQSPSEEKCGEKLSNTQ